MQDNTHANVHVEIPHKQYDDDHTCLWGMFLLKNAALQI